jgi:hypothetical protein
VNDPVCHRDLRRYWFPADRGFGIGVTATSESEARALANDAARQYLPAGARLSGVIPDVDVSTLDRNHVLPNIGPAAVRGVWYPRLNL